MKHYQLIIIISLMIGTIPSVWAGPDAMLGDAQCVYIIDMQDSFGDGWNGATLEADVNGMLADTFTMIKGPTAQEQLPVNALDEVAFTFNNGLFDHEITYQISLDGVQLFADGPTPSIGTVFITQCLDFLFKNGFE